MVSDTMERISKDCEVKDRDQERKESDLIPGDKVYIKNLNRENKLSLDYNPETHKVENKKRGRYHSPKR